MSNLILQSPTLDLFDSYIEYLKSMSKENSSSGSELKKIQDDAMKYLETTEYWRLGKKLPKGWTPLTTLWAVVENSVVGVVSIRHELNDQLLKIGGHIGYGIKPSERNKGYGTEACGLAITYAKKTLHINPVLITCNSDNLSARKNIEKNGGKLDDEVPLLDGKTKLRFWVS